MYCSHCGKKVNDTMLFCPFCGEPIVIPDQDEAASEPARDEVEQVPAADFVPLDPEHIESAEMPADTEAPAPAAEAQDAAAELEDWSRSRESLGAEPTQDAPRAEGFSPLLLEQQADDDGDWRDDIARRKEAAAPRKAPPRTDRREDEPVRLEGAAPKLEAGAKGKKPSRRPANTLVPPKTPDPGDMFMDDRAAAYDDAFDEYDDPAAPEFADGAFVYEDEEEGSFFMRHLRGIVGLAMFAILLLMFVIYAFSRSGQLSLARLNLAWSTDAYNQLGYENYQAERYDQAGLYYERALQRDGDNYGFASSAAMSYVAAGNTEKAAEMLKQCAEINPTLLEPYIYLLNLYPDAANRPWEVTQLLQQGYRQTGDSRLNVTG